MSAHRRLLPSAIKRVWALAGTKGITKKKAKVRVPKKGDMRRVMAVLLIVMQQMEVKQLLPCVSMDIVSTNMLSLMKDRA
jgi:hypothetical protein